MPSDQPPPRRSWLTILLAGLALSMGAVFLLVLPTGFIGPVIVFGGFLFFGMIGFHYLVWGRWLNQVLEAEREREQDESTLSD